MGNGTSHTTRARAIVLIALVSCATRTPSAIEACTESANAKRPDAAGLCLYSFLVTGDRSSGARVARALQSDDDSRWLVEYLATQVGDSPNGADAWLAAGIARRYTQAYDSALAALARASAHRSPLDDLGRMRDAVGELLVHRERGDYRAAAHSAALVYERSLRVNSPDDRAGALLNVAALLIEWGNLSVTAQLAAEAKQLIAPTSRHYVTLLQLEGAIEQAHNRPRLAKQAFVQGLALATLNHDKNAARDLQFSLVELSCQIQDFAAAKRQLADIELPLHAPNDRAIYAYDDAVIELGREHATEAEAIAARAMQDAPPEWQGNLASIRGRALVHMNQLAAAERELLRSIEAFEARRESLESDTFKSWLLAELRAPFEDLFLLYVRQHRLAEALAIVQRATARSIVDGLLQAGRSADPQSIAIASVGERVEGLRKLARSIRASPTAVMPSMPSLLARLRGAHVLTYFQARDELWLIAIDRAGVIEARSLAPVLAVREQVRAFTAHLDDAERAEQLGWLLLPDFAMPDEGAPIYVAPDDILAELPFEGLRRRSSYLIQRNPVSYVPSASALAVMSRAAPLGASVVIGDPDGTLPHARAEAIEVGHTLGVAALVGDQATGRVVADAKHARVLHVAAHTDTTAGPALRLFDAVLGPGSIIDQEISPRLVVLMACESAAPSAHDELASLAYAFIAAGAHAVVASRWAVGDDLARQFARELYRAGGAQDPVTGSAAAQRALIRAHVPVTQWSTFVSFGGFEPKESR